MNYKDIINWVKGFFVEQRVEVYIKPTMPVEPWPFPVVMGDHCPKETCAKKKAPAKKRAMVKDTALKSMRKSAPKNETAKKAAVKRAKKAAPKAK
jgi:hypothetical protein